MNERRNVLNVKLSDLTKNWSKEFYFVCYCTYLKPEQKKEWKENYWSKVQRRCREIEELDWESDVEYLKQCQAQAFCQTGILHTEKGNYDSARDYLEKAGDILEEFSFRYRMPECYFKTYLYLAKVYIEKHCDKDAADDCFHKAEKVLEGRWNLRHGQHKTLADWKAGNREQFRIELDNLQIIRQSDINRENAPKDCPEDEFEKKIDQLGEHLKKMYRKYGRKRKGLAANDEKRLWVKKQMDTYYASKGVYYKGQYLEVRKAKAKEKKERLLKKYFKKAAASFLHGINRDPRNTICAGNLAALLYDYQYHDSQKKYMDFAVSQIRETLSKNGALEKISKCRFTDDCIQFLLDHVLRVDRNNIYALNLKVLCAKEEGSKEAAGKKREAYPYMPEQFVLLKKAFVTMDHCAQKWHSCEQDELREIKLDIIRLYIAVLEYMKKTIYPRDIMEGLKVAHYTRSAVLPKLINQDGSSRLRIQNVKHLNDPSEGVLFIKHLKRKLGSTQAKLDDSVINDVLKMYDYKRRDEWNRKSSVYMGAFTSQIDHLNMWSRYGEQGKGCCLYIDAEQSFSDDVSVSILTPSTESEQFLYRLEDKKYPLYMLTYLPGNEKISLDAVRQYAKGRAAAERMEYDRIKAEGGGTKEQKRCLDEQNWWKVQARLVRDFEDVLEHLAGILDELQNDYDGYVKYVKNPSREGLIVTSNYLPQRAA